MKRFAFVISTVLFLAACSSAGTPSESLSPSDSSSPSETCWTSPLTGLCSVESDPTLVVKIDDVSAARPQYSLNEADMIVVEPVEGGLTRLFAVYQSNQPLLIGPVRSARITDPDIAEAFGKPGFAYSGSNNKVKPLLLGASIQLVGHPQGGKGYTREPGRDAPHNLIGTFADVISRIKDLAAAKMTTTSAFDFSDKPTAGTDIIDFNVKWPAERKTFTWNSTLNKWTIKSFKTDVVSLDAVTKEQKLAIADTVFVMNSELLPNPTSKLTPYPKTFGQGSGYIFTRGQVIPVTWKRPTVKDLPHFFDANGTEVSIAKGRLWWLIASTREKVTINYPASPSPSESAS
jgi:hypothetical protein